MTSYFRVKGEKAWHPYTLKLEPNGMFSLNRANYVTLGAQAIQTYVGLSLIGLYLREDIEWYDEDTQEAISLGKKSDSNLLLLLGEFEKVP
jgi:hypothetical protein